MKIPLFKTYSNKDDITAVTKVIKRGTFWAIGPEIEQFEKALSEYIGRKYVLCFNSGTSALHTLLLAYDIKDSDVIVPSFTFIATANSVVLAGGNPIFAEIENDTYGLDIEDVEKKITKDTKAIVLVHYGGFPAKYTEQLQALAKKKKILLIEDNAESMGASINNKKTGTFGDSAILSFCQNKIMSTGEGGAIITDDKEIYEKCKLIRSHGRVDLEKSYFESLEDNDYTQVGYNYRMSTITASLGLSQLNKIHRMIALRRLNANILNNKLSDIDRIILPKEDDGFFSVYQMYTIRLKEQKLRDKLQTFLAENGIMSKVYFNPVHLKSYYLDNHYSKEYDLQRTEKTSRSVLTIPFYPDMNKKEIDYIIKKIKEFFGKY